MKAMAQAADSIMAHASGDSIDNFPIDALDADGLPILPTLAVGAPSAPSVAMLGAASPNPFGVRTDIGIRVPFAGMARIVVYDTEGRRIATLFDGGIPAGLHSVSWDGLDSAGQPAPAGVYLVRLSGFGRSESRRVALTR